MVVPAPPWCTTLATYGKSALSGWSPQPGCSRAGRPPATARPTRSRRSRDARAHGPPRPSSGRGLSERACCQARSRSVVGRPRGTFAARRVAGARPDARASLKHVELTGFRPRGQCGVSGQPRSAREDVTSDIVDRWQSGSSPVGVENGSPGCRSSGSLHRRTGHEHRTSAAGGDRAFVAESAVCLLDPQERCGQQAPQRVGESKQKPSTTSGSFVDPTTNGRCVRGDLMCAVHRRPSASAPPYVNGIDARAFTRRRRRRRRPLPSSRTDRSQWTARAILRPVVV